MRFLLRGGRAGTCWDNERHGGDRLPHRHSGGIRLLAAACLVQLGLDIDETPEDERREE